MSRTKKTPTRLLSALLCLVMVLTLLPTVAFAYTAGEIPGTTGVGTSDDPVEVDTFVEFKAAMENTEITHVKLVDLATPGEVIPAQAVLAAAVSNMTAKTLIVDGNVTFYSPLGGGNDCLIWPRANLTIEGTGKLEYKHGNTGGSGAVVSMTSHVTLTVDGDVTLAGGAHGGSFGRAIFAQGGTINLNAGGATYTGYKALNNSGDIDAVLVMGSAQLNVSGGTFSATKHSGVLADVDTYGLTINFRAEHTGSVSLSGGTYYGIKVPSGKAIANYLAEGYATRTEGEAITVYDSSITVPAAPKNLTATPGNERVLLSWTAPSDGGSTITRYEYQQNGGAWTTTGGTDTSYIVNGLNNGTLYSFKVRAVNAIGNGAESTTATATPAAAPPATVPAAPTDLTATPGNGRVLLSWTAPSYGGRYIIRYEYQQNGGDWTTTGDTATSYMINRLTNDTLYSFKVRAVNDIGNGAESVAATATPAETANVPGAPTNITAVAGDGKATVSFTDPANNGGAPIIGYAVTANPGSKSVHGIASPMTITGLTNGIAYTFTVKAYNKFGYSVASVASNSVTPTAAADTTPPTLSATSASGVTATGATLNFTSDEAGTYYYLVYASATTPPNAATVKAQGTALAKGTSSATAAANTATVTGLTASTAYKAYVVVVDAAGNTSDVATISFSTTAAATTYTITFNANGGSVSIPSAVTGTDGKLASLPTPTRSGSYSFAGWYTLASGGTKVTTSYTFDSSMTIYAHWTYTGGTGGGGGTVYDYYTISATTGAGGSISPSGSVSVREGLDKVFTITPNTGYVISDVTVDGKSVGAVKTYTFDDVSKSHTINATFKAAGEHANPQTGVDMDFSDVKDGDWFYEDVAYVFEKGLMKGTSTTAFSPNNATTRGMIVTILYRLEGEPTVSGACPFDDVESGKYYEKAITWAAANKIVDGYGDSKFGPDDHITREQMAAILYRYADFKDYDITKAADLSKFSDSDEISSYAVNPLKWANANELVTGKGNGILDPQGEATRAQVAAILHRFCENIAK